MKYFIGNIIILFITSTIIFSCTKQIQGNKSDGNMVNLKDTTTLQDSDSAQKSVTNVLKKQSVKLPDYVPPNDGGNNGKWCNNRHKVIVKDSNCYFGKGLQKRHRYRWGRQNSD